MFRSKRALKWQLKRLNAELRDISRWLSNSDIAVEICARLCNFAAEDWEKIPVEDISAFRTRIGLDPKRQKDN